VNCGFLKSVGKSSSPLSLGLRDEDSLLNWFGLTPPFEEPVECHRGVEINPIAEVYVLDLEHVDAPSPRECTWPEAVLEPRGCPYFEPHRPGLSFGGHLDLQHRREEWRRTALVGLVSSVIGGLIATLLPFLFGRM
jgi:hypothetical protein